MTTEIIFVVEESIQGGFEARALAHSIYTEADTLEQLRAMVKDAVQCHFDEGDRPRLIRLNILTDVASHLEKEKDDLIRELF